MPLELQTDRVIERHPRARSRGPRGGRLGGKEEQGEVRTREADHPARRRPRRRCCRRSATPRRRSTSSSSASTAPSSRRRSRRRWRAASSVRALIAHTNRGGEKSLRKLEMRLLEAGVTVARTADDLPRYHGKMMIVDDDALRARLQLHEARHRARAAASASSPRDTKLVKEACDAVRGRLHAPAVRAGPRSAGRQPRDARASC